jgi:hypothetical protein
LVIANEEKLRLDKTDELIQNVVLILLDLIQPNELVKVLMQKIDVSEEDAIQIANKIDERVFERVRGIVAEKLTKGDSEIEEEIADGEDIIIDEPDKIRKIELLDNNLSFKERFKILSEQKEVKKEVKKDPYLESFD